MKITPKEDEAAGPESIQFYCCIGSFILTCNRYPSDTLLPSCANSTIHCFNFTVSLLERREERQGRLKVLENFLPVVTQTCCGWRCCCRRSCRCRCCRRRSVDAARCAFGSRSTFASLVRTEENIEGSPVDCHVR